MKKIVIAIFLCTTAAVLSAAPLYNVPQTLVQPNGDTLHCFASGDEFFNYLHDANGYTIIQNPQTGYYVYAVSKGEQIAASDYIAGKANPTLLGLEKHILPSARKIRDIVLQKRHFKRADKPSALSDMRKAAPSYVRNQGTLNNIVVFIRFADESESFSNLNYYDDICNTGAGSLKSFFKEVSYNLIDISSTFYPIPSGQIITSYKDSHPRSYYQPYSSVSNPTGYKNDDEYVEREHTLLKNAINAIASQVPTSINLDMNNDGKVDNVSFIVSGSPDGWADLLWPHRWELYSTTAYINGKQVSDYTFILNSTMRVNVLCHETFHALGAPDLYHYYIGTNLSAVGIWDVMEQTASPPQHMGAYMKYKYGNWINSIPTITSGTYSLKPVSTSATNNCYKVPISGVSNQFYILEYRKKASSSFESSIPGSGLLVYRINTDWYGNAEYDGTSVFDEIYVFRPGGTTTANGNNSTAFFSSNAGRATFGPDTDPYPFLTNGTKDLTNIVLSDISTAGDSITFSINYTNINVTAIAITTPSPINVNEPTSLSANVLPANATNKTLVWVVTNMGGRAHISENNLIGDKSGKIILTATAQDGSGTSAEKQIFIIDSKRPVSATWLNNYGEDGLLQVNYGEAIGLIEIYTLSGSKIKEEQYRDTQATSQQINLSSLPKGTYIINVWNINKTNHSSTKIIW